MNMLIRKGIESSIQVVDDKIEKLIQSIEEKAIQAAGEEEDPRWSEFDERIESSAKLCKDVLQRFIKLQMQT